MNKEQPETIVKNKAPGVMLCIIAAILLGISALIWHFGVNPWLASALAGFALFLVGTGIQGFVGVEDPETGEKNPMRLTLRKLPMILGFIPFAYAIAVAFIFAPNSMRLPMGIFAVIAALAVSLAADAFSPKPSRTKDRIDKFYGKVAETHEAMGIVDRGPTRDSYATRKVPLKEKGRLLGGMLKHAPWQLIAALILAFVLMFVMPFPGCQSPKPASPRAQVQPVPQPIKMTRNSIPWKGKLTVAVLQFDPPKPEFKESADKATRQVLRAAAVASGENSSLRIVTPDDIKRAIGRDITSKNYNYPDHELLRDKLGVDMILLGYVENTYSPKTPNTFIPMARLFARSSHSGSSLPINVCSYSGYYQGLRPQVLAEFFPADEHEKLTSVSDLLKQPPTEAIRTKPCCRSAGDCLNGSQDDNMATELQDAWDAVAKKKKQGRGFRYATAGQVGQLITHPGDADHLPYYLHSPPGQTQTGWSYPLLIYLHGTGSHSEELSQKLLRESPIAGSLAKLNPKLKSSFVLLPQASDSKLDNRPDGERLFLYDLNKLVVEIIRTYPIDLKRIYVAGLSQGGFRAWNYTELLENRIAAMLPICGGQGENGISCITETAVWAHHSTMDDRVDPMRQVNALRRLVRGPFGYGDADVLAHYPFAIRDAFNSSYGKCPACMDDLQQVRLSKPDTDMTATVANGRARWVKGTRAPAGKYGFTLYASNNWGHCFRPFANPDIWDWLYNQSLPGRK